MTLLQGTLLSLALALTGNLSTGRGHELSAYRSGMPIQLTVQLAGRYPANCASVWQEVEMS